MNQCGPIVTDKNNVFYKNIKFDEITSENFVNFNDIYLKDKYSVYFVGRDMLIKMPNADVETFSYSYESGATDKNFYYEEFRPLPLSENWRTIK